ncbi:protein NUCLEAR FUSION DEFECTIVE 4-like [Salvia hispanica]|uniref:protein NUCLEAR FUSION DEFECTIVE 4-like n=1 Tax=Salvia hispanica TaxID=49212 RepID=UPI0020093CDE|nr:protein NUCLEAR FUSION DEFECTIVE 4-like [Salvia hispanica]
MKISPLYTTICEIDKQTITGPRILYTILPSTNTISSYFIHSTINPIATTTMEASKWTAAAASIWIQCSCGASYAFGIYSPILKSSQNYDQSTLDTISVFKDIGANAGILSGLLYAAAPRTWIVHAAGAAQCLIGYLFLWLAVTGKIPQPHVAAVCLFMFLAAHAQTFFNTANVVTAVENFPGYSGTVVGIMKGFLGLSGAVIIQVYQTLFPEKPTTFLLILALAPSLLSLALMYLVRAHPTSSADHDKAYLNGFSLISMVVAAYVMLLIILENVFVLAPWMRALTLTILFLILSSPLHVAVKANKHEAEKRSSLPSLKAPLIVDNETRKPNETNDHEMNLVQALRTLSFWLLFVAMLCGMGSGLATINNISQIGESLGYTAVERSTLVSLWSIWNFLGRVGAGLMSDTFLHKKGYSRPLFMTVTLAAMTAGHVIIGSGFPGNLYVGSVLVGICYGSQWSLMPTITSEIFGVRHMGTIFNTIAIASPLGSYIFSVRLIGYIYDRNAGDESSCSGTHCFMSSFFAMAVVSLFGSLVALGLFVKTRKVYARIAHSRMLA